MQRLAKQVCNYLGTVAGLPEAIEYIYIYICGMFLRVLIIPNCLIKGPGHIAIFFGTFSELPEM